MKEVYRSLFAIGIAAFFLVMFVLVASFTKAFATNLYPDNIIAQYGSIFLADAGALIWLGTFVYWSKTKMQRVTAFVMFLFDLMIAGIMIAVNTLTSLDVTEEITRIATFSLALSGILNLAALYWYHMHSEDVQKEIEIGDIEAEFSDEAITALRAKKKQIAAQAADILGDRLLDDTLERFHLSRSLVSGNPADQVIDGKLEDPKKESLVDKVRAAVNGKGSARQYASDTDTPDAGANPTQPPRPE